MESDRAPVSDSEMESLLKTLRDYNNSVLWLRLNINATYDFLRHTFIREFDVSKIVVCSYYSVVLYQSFF